MRSKSGSAEDNITGTCDASKRQLNLLLLFIYGIRFCLFTASFRSQHDMTTLTMPHGVIKDLAFQCQLHVTGSRLHVTRSLQTRHEPCDLLSGFIVGLNRFKLSALLNYDPSVVQRRVCFVLSLEL